MVKNQLFRVNPTLEFTENFLKLFVPKGFDEYYQFSRQTIVDKNILKKINIPYFSDMFKKIYLPCKYKNYIQNITEKKCITVLRQLLKIHSYNVIGSEKYSNGKKKLVYNIKKLNPEKKVKKYNLTLKFD